MDGPVPKPRRGALTSARPFGASWPPVLVPGAVPRAIPFRPFGAPDRPHHPPRGAGPAVAAPLRGGSSAPASIVRRRSPDRAFPMIPLRAAVVGTGFIGPVHVEALRRLGHTVTGVLGSTPERGRTAAERLGLPRAYADLDELLADPAVQVVHVTSPNRYHFDQCRRCLAAGKHVVCEKPL